MFIACRLGDDVYLDKDDNIRNYVVFTNTHNGTSGVMALMTPLRVICQNTLNMAIRGAKNKIVFRHTKNVNERLDWEIDENRKIAAKFFEDSAKFNKVFLDRMLQLKTERVSTDYIRDITAKFYLSEDSFDLYKKNNFNLEGIEDIAPVTRNKIEALRDSIENGIGQDKHRGTKLWIINGLTTMLHNEKSWKSGEDEMKSLLGGDGANKLQKMYNMIAA
jgi:hypothetical protein